MIVLMFFVYIIIIILELYHQPRPLAIACRYTPYIGSNTDSITERPQATDSGPDI